MTNEDLALFKAAVGGDPDEAFKLASQMFDVPYDLARTVETNESSGKQSAVSPKGAIGRMQLMPGTAAFLKVNPHDEIENIWGGVKYLGDQLKEFKTPELALAAYNAGPGAVKKYGGVPPYKETKGYVARILDALGPSEANAAEPTVLSDEELAKIAGVDLGKVSKIEPSDEELAKIAGVKLERAPVESPTIAPTVSKAFPAQLDLRAPLDVAKEDILSYPGKVQEGLQSILDLPHQLITKPYIVEPLQKLMGKLPESGSVEIPPAETLPGESGIINEQNLRELVPHVVGAVADLPVYGGAAKVLQAAGGITGSLLNKLPSNALITPAQETARAVELGNIPALTKQLQETTGLEQYLKSGNWDIANEIADLKKVAFKGGSVVQDEAAQRVATLQGLLKARSTSLDRVVADKNITNDLLKTLQQTEISVPVGEAVPHIDPKSVKYLYGGGPDSETIIKALGDETLKVGASAAVGNIANKLGISAQDVLNAIRTASQTSVGSMGSANAQRVSKTAAAVDLNNAPLGEAVAASDFKANIPSLRDVGTDVPPVPKMPYEIVPEDTTPKGNLKPLKSEFLSPSVVARALFKGEGPILDWMKAWHQTLFEQPYYRRFLNNLFEGANLMDDVVASEKAARETIGPLSKRLETVIQDYEKVQSNLKDAEALLKKQAVGSAPYQATEQRIADLKKIHYPGEAAAIEKELETAVQTLERQHPNIRIKRAAEGNKDSWALLDANEQQVATKLQEFYKQFGDRFKQQGVPTLPGSYTHHVYHWGGYDTDAGLKFFADKLWWQPETTPQLLTFLSRKGAADWFPLAYQSTDAYIGGATRKLAYNPWYEKWTPAMNSWDVSGMQGTAKWLRDFLGRNMTTRDADIVEKSANALTQFEYAHYLLGNFSPAILHAAKVFQTPAYWGFKAAGKGLAQYGEAMMSKAAGTATSENLRAIEFYNNAPAIIQSMEQSPAWAGTMQPSFWQKMRGGTFESPVANVASALLNPTRLTEHFDRGVQVLSAINAGEKAGATAQMMNNAIMDSLVRMNFYGWDAPAFMMKTGYNRAITAFQQQPWKLAEMKLGLANDSIKEVKGMLLGNAVEGTTDIYGKSAWPKFARLAILMGGLWEAGQLAGLDLTKHTVHAPFVTDTMGGGHGPAISPAIMAGATIKKSFDEGWQEGLKQYLSYGGAPQKMLQERIPERYTDSRAQWLTGIPSVGWRETAAEKSEAIQARQRRKALRAAALHGEDISPYQFLQQLWEEK